MPTKQSRADTVIAYSLLANSRNPAVAIVPPQLTHQMSTLLNKLTKSDCAPSALARPLPKTSGDGNIPQFKASCVQADRNHNQATFEVVKTLMEEIMFTKTPWPILTDAKYTMVEKACKLAF